MPMKWVIFAIVFAGVVMMIHALARSDKSGYESGAFIWVILEGLGGAACVVVAIILIVFRVMS